MQVFSSYAFFMIFFKSSYACISTLFDAPNEASRLIPGPTDVLKHTHTSNTQKGSRVKQPTDVWLKQDGAEAACGSFAIPRGFQMLPAELRAPAHVHPTKTSIKTKVCRKKQQALTCRFPVSTQRKNTSGHSELSHCF